VSGRRAAGRANLMENGKPFDDQRVGACSGTLPVRRALRHGPGRRPPRRTGDSSLKRTGPMKVEFVNPFVTAAREVIKKEVGAEVDRGKIYLHRSSITSHEITAMVAVMGAVRGLVLYGMSDETARHLVAQMMEQPCPELDELAQSGIAELANVITGQAGILLSRTGYSVQISPPALIVGHNTIISTLDLTRLVIPLETEYGVIEAQVALKEAVLE
jgi:chemotaxis protein CheX